LDIVICDDTEKDANSLRLFIERYFVEINCLCRISVYESGDAFLIDFAENRINDLKIVFLDVYMPGTNGVDTARKIRETDKNVVIVFTTTSRNHGLDGYSVYALQYLVKPLSYPEVISVLDKCTSMFADSIRSIEVMSDRLTVRVYLKDIMYVESFNTALLIHTLTGKVKTFLPLSEIEKQLEGSTFLRTQRSFIVNMRHIKRMTADGFVLENDITVPIRRDDKLAIKQAYRDYLSALTWDGA